MAAVVAAGTPTALAQQTARPAPADPAAVVPAAKYESAFAGYVPHREAEIASWRDINDQAARIGGHVGAMRQSGMHGDMPAAGSASPSAAPLPAQPTMPGHGSGH